MKWNYDCSSWSAASEDAYSMFAADSSPNSWKTLWVTVQWDISHSWSPWDELSSLRYQFSFFFLKYEWNFDQK